MSRGLDATKKGKRAQSAGLSKRAGLTLLAALSTFLLSSCESTQEDNLADAQNCLNIALPSQADQCSAMVAGDSSAAAYQIRCSAHYLAQGFTDARFANAFQQIQTGTTGTNSLASAFGYLIFPTTTGSDGSIQTLSDCQAAGVDALTEIALLTATATLIAVETSAIISPGSDGSITAAQLQQAASLFSGSAASLGTLAIETNSIACGTGSALSGNSICTQFASAISAGGSSATPSAIGAELLTLIQQ